MGQTVEVMSKERLDHYITEAAKAAGYEQGFGIPGCDLRLKQWTVAYARQSSEEQATEGTSMEFQDAQLSGYCKLHGWTIINAYTDPGFSGKMVTDRDWNGYYLMQKSGCLIRFSFLN